MLPSRTANESLNDTLRSRRKSFRRSLSGEGRARVPEDLFAQDSPAERVTSRKRQLTQNRHSQDNREDDNRASHRRTCLDDTSPSPKHKLNATSSARSLDDVAEMLERERAERVRSQSESRQTNRRQADSTPSHDRGQSSNADTQQNQSQRRPTLADFKKSILRHVLPSKRASQPREEDEYRFRSSSERNSRTSHTSARQNDGVQSEHNRTTLNSSAHSRRGNDGEQTSSHSGSSPSLMRKLWQKGTGTSQKRLIASFPNNTARNPSLSTTNRQSSNDNSNNDQSTKGARRGFKAMLGSRLKRKSKRAELVQELSLKESLRVRDRNRSQDIEALDSGSDRVSLQQLNELPAEELQAKRLQKPSSPNNKLGKIGNKGRERAALNDSSSSLCVEDLHASHSTDTTAAATSSNSLLGHASWHSTSLDSDRRRSVDSKGRRSTSLPPKPGEDGLGPPSTGKKAGNAVNVPRTTKSVSSKPRIHSRKGNLSSPELRFSTKKKTYTKLYSSQPDLGYSPETPKTDTKSFPKSASCRPSESKATSPRTTESRNKLSSSQPQLMFDPKTPTENKLSSSHPNLSYTPNKSKNKKTRQKSRHANSPNRKKTASPKATSKEKLSVSQPELHFSPKTSTKEELSSSQPHLSFTPDDSKAKRIRKKPKDAALPQTETVSCRAYKTSRDKLSSSQPVLSLDPAKITQDRLLASQPDLGLSSNKLQKKPAPDPIARVKKNSQASNSPEKATQSRLDSKTGSGDKRANRTSADNKVVRTLSKSFPKDARARKPRKRHASASELIRGTKEHKTLKTKRGVPSEPFGSKKDSTAASSSCDESSRSRRASSTKKTTSPASYQQEKNSKQKYAHGGDSTSDHSLAVEESTKLDDSFAQPQKVPSPSKVLETADTVRTSHSTANLSSEVSRTYAIDSTKQMSDVTRQDDVKDEQKHSKSLTDDETKDCFLNLEAIAEDSGIGSGRERRDGEGQREAGLLPGEIFHDSPTSVSPFDSSLRHIWNSPSQASIVERLASSMPNLFYCDENSQTPEDIFVRAKKAAPQGGGAIFHDDSDESPGSFETSSSGDNHVDVMSEIAEEVEERHEEPMFSHSLARSRSQGFRAELISELKFASPKKQRHVRGSDARSPALAGESPSPNGKQDRGPRKPIRRSDSFDEGETSPPPLQDMADDSERLEMPLELEWEDSSSSDSSDDSAPLAFSSTSMEFHRTDDNGWVQSPPEFQSNVGNVPLLSASTSCLFSRSTDALKFAHSDVTSQRRTGLRRWASTNDIQGPTGEAASERWKASSATDKDSPPALSRQQRSSDAPEGEAIAPQESFTPRDQGGKSLTSFSTSAGPREPTRSYLPYNLQTGGTGRQGMPPKQVLPSPLNEAKSKQGMRTSEMLQMVGELAEGLKKVENQVALLRAQRARRLDRQASEPQQDTGAN